MRVGAPTHTRDASRQAPIWRGPQAGHLRDVGMGEFHLALALMAGRAHQDPRPCGGVPGCNDRPTIAELLADGSPIAESTNPDILGEWYRSSVRRSRSPWGYAAVI